MYHRLVESPGAEVLNSLRLCVSGSAPLSADLHQRLKNNIGVDVLERYGTTETLMLISNPYNGERRSGSVGIPLPGVEVILDEVSGEILVRGPSVFDGYWGNEQATIEALIDGWFHTGDLAEIDEDGYLSIVGRAKDLIITGGFNVYPREVEDVLIVHNDIAEIAVAGIQSEEWGEEVAAWVVPVQNSTCPTVSELRDFAMDLLTDYKIPRRVIGVSSLPRNSLGKVLRYELKETTAYE